MTGVGIIAFMFLGLCIGALGGMWWGERAGGDYNFYPLWTVGVGGGVGAVLGTTGGCLLLL